MTLSLSLCQAPSQVPRTHWSSGQDGVPTFVEPTSQQETPDLGVGRQGCHLSIEMVILTTARALGTQSPWQTLGTGQDCPPQCPLSPPHAESPAPVLGLLAQAPAR